MISRFFHRLAFHGHGRSGFLFSLCLGFLSAGAHASVNLKQVQVIGPSGIDLVFDGKISKSQVDSDFFNDVIQLSLKDVSVYPAKIAAVETDAVTKVFAYQYAPKLVRCRLSVKGKAEDYKRQVVITANGKMISIRFAASASANSKPVSDRIARSDASPVRDPSGGASADFSAVRAKTAPTGAEGVKLADPEERALLEKVMKAPVPVESPVRSHASSAQTSRVKSEEDAPLAGGKPLPSPFSALGKLIWVLALFGAIAWAAKRWQTRGTAVAGALPERVRRWIGMRQGRPARLIEVITNHYLGPKKSLAIIRVAGRNMVIGITAESINLISHLPADADMGEELLAAMNDPETLGDESAAAIASPGISSAPSPSVARAAKAAAASAPPRASAGGSSLGDPLSALLEASGPAVFSDVLKNRKPADLSATYRRPDALNAARSATEVGVRSQIKNRLEGLKPL